MKHTLTLLGRLLPPWRREWPEAMLAELEALPQGAPRKRFATGCVRVLLVAIVAARLRFWAESPRSLALAFVTGLVIAALDQVSETRGPMWIALITGSAAFAWRRPAAAWRWGLVVALGVPCLAAVRDTRGPYAFDRADAGYGLPPAVLTAVMVATLRRRRTRALFGLALTAIAAAPPNADSQSASIGPRLTAPDLSTFADSAFAGYVRDSPHPSLAFVVVRDGAIVFARGYGAEDRAGARPVDPERTLFWMASVSKLFTTEAVIREVERGRIELEAPVARYLDWELPSRKDWPAITVEDLLSHTSGLDEPFMQGTVNDSARLVPLGDYLRAIRWRAGTRPGEALRYSNHGMAIAGRIVERASGMPFADYVEREIFAALGMLQSTFRQPVAPELAPRIATAGTDSAADYLLPAPAGAMLGTAADMGRFLISQLDTAGQHAASLQTIHATHWRAHAAVPGIALGWFETNLGGVPALFHTGARHHFSVAWLAPEHRVGLFLVHSMRQGGRFQNLRTAVVRAFVERYFSTATRAGPVVGSRPVDGVYRPALLATTTVERAGYLFLDTPVRSATNGGITVRVPGGLGAVTAYPIRGDVFEVREGGQAGLRLGFPGDEQVQRMAMGGTLLDPVVFTRLAWWQRGLVHAVLLGTAGVALVLGGTVRCIQRLRWRRRGIRRKDHGAWVLVEVAGGSLLLAPLALGAVLLSTPEVGAADHLRSGLRVVLTLLSVGAAAGITLPIVTLLGWRRGAGSAAGKVSLVALSLLGPMAGLLLWHYRLVGFQF